MTANGGGKGTSANNYLESKHILNSNEALNGLGYGDYAQRFLEHVCSASPDSFNKDAGILFLRTSIVQTYTDDSVIGSLRNIIDTQILLNRTNPFSHVISTKDAICISPLFSFFSKGTVYSGEQLNTTEQVYEAARKDMRASPAIFLNITPPQKGMQTIEGLSKNHWIETRPFTLAVPENSRLVSFFDTPLFPGTEYKDTVVVGYFVILKDLSEGYWKFDFGGIGANDYITHARIHILVKKDPIVFPADISGQDFSPKKGDGEGLDLSDIYSKL